MAGSEGRTLLEVLCFHCAWSPRAPRSVVELSGGPGFPLSLWGTCGTCGVAYVARQSGRVIARPLALVYPAEAELRAYRVADVDDPGTVLDEGQAVWELPDNDTSGPEAAEEGAADSQERRHG